MTWTDLTYVDCSVLTAAKMTALQGNLSALAAGEPGAPPLHIDGVSSLALVHAASGFTAPQVSSLGTLHVASGVVGPQVGSLGTLHVASAATFGAEPSGTPAANTQYRKNIVKGFITYLPTSATATNNLDGVLESFNVSGLVDNGAGDQTIHWDRDFADSQYTVVGNASGPVLIVQVDAATIATGTCDIRAFNPSSVPTDGSRCSVIVVGNQS